MDMIGVHFCIVMGVLGYWVFRDIGYRACRRSFLGPILVVGLWVFYLFAFLVSLLPSSIGPKLSRHLLVRRISALLHTASLLFLSA
jgi:uncharacterized membrane-anchored protein